MEKLELVRMDQGIIVSPEIAKKIDTTCKGIERGEWKEELEKAHEEAGKEFFTCGYPEATRIYNLSVKEYRAREEKREKR